MLWLRMSRNSTYFVILQETSISSIYQSNTKKEMAAEVAQDLNEYSKPYFKGSWSHPTNKKSHFMIPLRNRNCMMSVFAFVIIVLPLARNPKFPANIHPTHKGHVPHESSHGGTFLTRCDMCAETKQSIFIERQSFLTLARSEGNCLSPRRTIPKKRTNSTCCRWIGRWT